MFGALLGAARSPRRISEGELRFHGVAATVALDRQGDRMSEAALEGMATGGPVPLLERHGGQAVGTVERRWVEDGELRVEGRLGQALAGRSRALSVGGRVREVRYEADAGTAGTVRCVEAAELHHVALCEPSEAQNPETWVEEGRGEGWWRKDEATAVGEAGARLG